MQHVLFVRTWKRARAMRGGGSVATSGPTGRNMLSFIHVLVFVGMGSVGL